MKQLKQPAINKMYILINSINVRASLLTFNVVYICLIHKKINLPFSKLMFRNCVLLKLFILLFAFIITACDSYEENEQRDFRLSLISGSDKSINELKDRWFFCERCLSKHQCKSNDVKQCNMVTLPDRDNALSQAVVKANIEAVIFLVNVAKTDVDSVTGRYHETPLMIAAYYGTQKHQDIARFLISKGANVNAIDLTKMTILETAIWKNNLNFSKILIENGADPSLTIDGKKEGAACISAIKRKRFEFIPIIPGCCALSKKSFNISPDIILQCPK